jgi:hypothetical protein
LRVVKCPTSLCLCKPAETKKRRKNRGLISISIGCRPVIAGSFAANSPVLNIVDSKCLTVSALVCL